MTYISTKTYGHDLGLACCFRQHRAQSHCRFTHGYALGFRFEFEAEELDERGWVVDFGSLKSLKQILEHTFDHHMVVAEDDPALPQFMDLNRQGIISVRVLPAVGCEAFARMAYGVADVWLKDNGYAPRVWMRSVEVKEHGANSAIYFGGNGDTAGLSSGSNLRHAEPALVATGG